jgi:preprotein translocase subunit SecB
MTMTEKFKILARYIKDMSSETRDVETFLSARDHITKYQLNIDITSQALKNKMIEVNTTLKFENKDTKIKKSHFEIVYAAVVKVDEDIKDKKDLEKIILCDVPNAIYPNLEKSFLDMMHNSGHPNIKLEKKIDFNKLYSEKFN